MPAACIPGAIHFPHNRDSLAAARRRFVYQELFVLQLALAALHEVDYLLSWNYAHMANPEVQKRVEALNGRLKLTHTAACDARFNSSTKVWTGNKEGKNSYPFLCYLLFIFRG